MATRRGSARLAISSPWGPTPAAQAQQGANLDEELAAFVRRRKDLLTVGALGITDQGGGQPVVQPQPQSVGEMLQVGKFAVDVSQSIAQGAQAQAQATKEELERAKQQAGDAYEAGKQEALTLWQMIDERDARHQERIDSLTKELRDANESRRDSESARVLSELKAQMDAIQGQHKREVAELKRRAEQAEARAAEAAKPKSRYEQALDLLRSGEDPQSPAVRALLGYGEPGQETPQERWQRLHMDKVEDEIVDERARRRALQTNAIEHDAAVKAGQRKIYDHADKALSLFERWLEGTVGGGGSEQTGKAGLPHDGFPATLSEMRAQSQAIMAQQQARQMEQGGAE